MTAVQKDPSIKGESIQSLYGSYINNIFLVNRRYQRKLVWNIEEKRSFIDSILNSYPVPLILLAEVNSEKERKLEIIDGMQRLNAIMSFIEQEFDIDGKYFDLDAMADTKLLKDSDKITQKTEILDRAKCANIARYEIPLSIFQESNENHIDEVFRRLNSGGRHLSKQELRQAGATSKFASIVRKLSSNIRGDSSASDILDLNSMKKISITNRNLEYGISVEEIFWVKNSIISKEDLRQSKDEEIIADIVTWASLDKSIRSSSDILNQLYGYGNINDRDADTPLSNQIEIQIQKINEDIIISNIQFVFDKIIEIVNLSQKSFNSLLFENQQSRIARYFQIVYFALYDLLIERNMSINNTQALIKHLNKAGDRIIRLSSGGGNWSAKEKETQTNALIGVIQDCFEKNSINDPGRNQWITKFENILMQSSTEQTLYDFKVGLHSLENSEQAKNIDSFSKIVKTLTAMANTLPKSTGYCILGVADNKHAADRHNELFESNHIKYSNFYITGIDSEAEKFHGNIDKYFTKIAQLVKNEPISDRDKDNISRNLSIVKYFNKSIVIFKIESGNIPSIYDGKYFVRHGSNIQEVIPENFSDLFQRFSS